MKLFTHFKKLKDLFQKPDEISANNLTVVCSIQDDQLRREIRTVWDHEDNWGLQRAKDVLHIMYSNKDLPVSVVTVMIRVYPFDGVGFTHDGKKNGIKEVHISSKYINRIPQGRRLLELEGVLSHELVHAFQYNGSGTAPGGFIEGLADFYRLRLGLAPPHWKREVRGKKWDDGYEKTGFFLDWVEIQYPGTMERINTHLKTHRWHDVDPFERYTGEKVHSLFDTFSRHSFSVI